MDGRGRRIPATVRADAIAALRSGMKPQMVAKRYGISEKTAYDLAKSTGVKRRRWKRWTSAEDDMIRTWYPSKGGAWDGWKVLMPDRNPTEGDIQARASKLGVHVDA
jgi:hypothetical protein